MIGVAQGAGAGDRPRVLVLGQGAQSTGFARVLHSLLPNLCDAFDIVHFAINLHAPLAQGGWRTVHNGYGDPMGQGRLPALLDEVRPDLLFLLHDHWFYGLHADAVAAHRSSTGRQLPVVVYVPVEWGWLPPSDVRRLHGADRLVAFTRFGRDVLTRLGPERGGRSVHVIPHGLDRGRFHPIRGGRAAARAMLFPDRPELADAFIVLNANRNVARKRLDLTLAAFARFAASRPNAWLYLHCGLRDRGIDILERAEALGIRHRLLLSADGPDKPSFDDARLNLVYNACDVGVNTSTGEGWGLVAFEHAATGAAQLVPDHSACRELWAGAAPLIPARIDPDTHAAEVDVAVLAGWLGRLHESPAELAHWSEAAKNRAADPSLDWDAIAARWAALWRATLAGAKPQ